MSTNSKEDDRVLTRALSSPLTSALRMVRKEARSLTFSSVGFIRKIHNVIDAVSESDRKILSKAHVRTAELSPRTCLRIAQVEVDQKLIDGTYFKIFFLTV
mmetsp:Transcript_31887/g.73398  ORF Transcript_31887/g.73398 Transcript_31887/m.73398 type:complete len:101 (-) Transcript_31887:2562-2864(-)